MALSNFGIFHTAIGVIALVAAVTDFIKNKQINLGGTPGKIYFYATLVTSLTALGLSKQGGFNAGHVFALFIVVLIIGAFFLYRARKGYNRARYFEIFFLSFSFLLSLVPTVNETFTRVPVGHPWAKSPTDPIIAKTLLLLLVLFIAGYILQFRRQSKINRSARAAR